jgi:hypothetical protein
MRFLRRACVLSASAFLLFAVATQANAQFRPKISVQTYKGRASIVINERIAVQLLTPNGPLSPAQRAQLAASRLQAMTNAGADSRKLTVKAIGGRVAVLWDNSQILVATKRESAAQKKRPGKLGWFWVANIRYALAVPPLTVKPSGIVVPLGETRQVTIGGIAQGPIEIADQRPDVSQSKLGPDGRTLVVKGLAPGSAVVAIGRSGLVIGLDVSVRKYAGRVRTPTPVTVTGSPAPWEMCQDAARLQVARCVESESGARVQVLNATTKLPDVPQGYQTDLTFPVRIEGEGYIPVASSCTVRVVNMALPKTPVGKLFYSNSPEQVKKFGQLFAGRLDLGKADRLLYHHQNMMGKPFVFNITLVNASSVPAKVQIVKADPGPLVDTVAVGYRAGARFLPIYMNDIGEVVDVPPMSKLAVTSCEVDKIYTTSGIMQFRQLDGQPMLLRVSADMPEDGIAEEGSAIAVHLSDSRGELSPWVYPSPTKSIDAEYIVGKAWAFIRVGKHGIADVTQAQQLYGNYGVVYDIKLRLANPNPVRKSVSLLFESAAGLASGVFLIDGKYVKVTHVAPPLEVPLANYTLGPNESKTVSIKTIPLAGSAYPATILVRS